MMDEKKTLKQAAALLKKGEKEDARQLLISLLKENPNSADTWWLLSYTVSKKEQQTDCLKRALRLNAEHKRAHARLASLNNKPSPETPNPPQKKKQKIRGGIIAIVAVVFCLGILGIGYFAFNIMNATKVDVPLPTPTGVFPTNTPSPPQSLPPTWIPMPVATIPTSMPSEDNSLTDTSTFQPGDPTATPLGTNITDSNFIEGKKAYDAGSYEDAITLMSAVIKSNPNLAPPYRYRGTAYWYLGDCVSGLEDHEKALSINPDYAESWAGRGLTHSCLGNFEQELEDFQKALSLDPSLAFVHHNLGVHYYDIGDYERSLEEYSLSVAIDPNRAGAWSGRSEALAGLGRYKECISSATRALEINPEEWIAYGDRAYCKTSMELHATAIEDYKKYISNNESDAIGWYNLGIAQRKSGNSQDAIFSNTKALELEPSYHEAYINRGYAFFTLGKFTEALNDYDAALQFGDIPLAYTNRGETYLEMGKFNEAIADNEKALSLYPINAKAYCVLSRAYFEVGRYQDSLNAALSSNQIAPDCGGQKLVETQARAYYALGNYEQALFHINEALNYGSYALGYYYRGIINEAAANKTEAIHDLEQFLAFVTDKNEWKDEIADATVRLARLKQ